MEFTERQQSSYGPGTTIVRRSSVATIGASDVPATGTLVGAGEALLFKKIGANLNSTADQALTVVAAPAKYQVTDILVTNVSTTLAGSTAAGGIYTAATKGGTAIVAAGQGYTALTGATIILALTIASAGQASQTASPLYLSLTTAHGSAVTADLYVFGRPLP